jgi:hypothetical protein
MVARQGEMTARAEASAIRAHASRSRATAIPHIEAHASPPSGELHNEPPLRTIVIRAQG